MSSEIAINVKNVSKCYNIYSRPRDRLLQMFTRSRKRYFREFWALKGISFEVARGETVGIVGQNGSGKSTLLQIICGTLNPTDGTVETKGRIAALLELGSGFNPEFSGRENVYLNASILGLSTSEIDQRFQSIIDFADIGTFLDQPVKTYSSGMVVRLAFAVQAQVDPDILIVDEALAVGDAKFQAKCFDRLKQLKERGTSILLVTHSSDQIVTHCSNAILLDRGTVVAIGQPRTVVNRYMDLLFGKGQRIEQNDVDSVPLKQTEDIEAENPHSLSNVEDVFYQRPGYNHHEYRWGDGSAKILDFHLDANGVAYPSMIKSGDPLTLRLSVLFREELTRPILGITIKTKEGVTIYGANSESLEIKDLKSAGQKNSIVHAVATFNCSLAPGDYFVSLGIATNEGGEIIPRDRRYDAIHLHVGPLTSFHGLVDLDMKLEIQNA